MSEQEVSAKVSGAGLEVGAKGDGVSQIVDALTGFVSPLTEGAGYLGDMLRFYRQQNAMRGIAKAKELAAELGVPLQPVPPKFLVNWVEGVSLEDVSDEDSVTDLWAGLLVSASQGMKPGHHLYRRILGEFTHQHAECLRFFLHGQSTISHEDFENGVLCWNDYVSANELILEEDDGVEFERLVKDLNAHEAPGLVVCSAELSVGSGWLPIKELTLAQSDSFEIAQFRNLHVVEMLKTLGLLQEYSYKKLITHPTFFNGFATKSERNKGGIFEIEMICLTQVGRDFMLSCIGGK